MTAEMRSLIESLVSEINQNAASGLVSRQMILLATQVQQQLSRESAAAKKGGTGSA